MARILTLKLGRPVRPDYVHQVKGSANIPVNKTTKMYLRADVEKADIRQRAKA